jgi:predicted RNA binding protein YcfA (HicA-like mRNA interferase family)
MRLPQITTAALLRAFIRLGFEEKSRANSHIKVVYPTDATRYASIPCHKGATISVGSLRNILKSTRVDVEELKRYI